MSTKITVALCAILAGSGCSTTSDMPLLFGTSNVTGISMGGSLAGSGGEFTLGYKGHDFAVVPITVRQPDGSEPNIGSAQPGVEDAYSVLGQFGASGTRTSDQASTALGKFFATGLAARTLAGGFAQKLGGTDETKPCWPRENPPAPASSAKPGSAPPLASPAARPETQGGKLLLFTQYTSLGFAAGSSAAETGFDLTLGWKDRNLAIVPVVTRDATGTAETLNSRNAGFYDAYSVLGQFSFESSQGSALSEAGLGKFFSTGGAALRLSQGFAIRLCEEYEAVKAAR